jgi:hypothetical protein
VADRGDPDVRPEARIPRPHPVLDTSPVTFSFKFLDVTDNEKFVFGHCTMDFFEHLLVELQRLSRGTVMDFCEYDNERHSHAIIFENTQEPQGFANLSEQVEPEEYWQFGIRPDRPWRVHGFFIDSVFYVVWLDPKHNLAAG